MKPLFEFFPPNFLDGAVTKHYKLGEYFTLHGKIGVVMSGVVAVDVAGQYTEDYLTIRLTTFGDILNLEQITNSNTSGYRYVCDSPTASIALVDIIRFEKELRSKSAEIQNVITQSILSQLLRHSNDLVDTLTAVGRSNAREQVLWAIRRFSRLAGYTAGIPACSERIAAHIGVRPETASRTISLLCEEGVLNRDMKSKTLTIRTI